MNKPVGPTIELTNEHTLKVSGDLSFYTVVDLRTLGCKFIDKLDTAVFDLQNSIAKDNSALALFTAWLRYAKANNKTIKFCHVPKQLIDIAKLTGLEQLLPMKQ